jgi:hypothetical protein
MDKELNTAESLKAAVVERNEELRFQRRYYDSLHNLDIYPVNVDEYYDGLKDWSRFKEPRDTSRKDAEKDSGISRFLKFKAIFSETSKSELHKKKASAVALQKQYSELSAKEVDLKRKQFYQRQEDNNKAVEKMRQNLMRHNPDEIIEFFQAVLSGDGFTLNRLEANERYQSFVAVKDYDPTTSELSYSFRIPNQEEICVIDRFLYDDNEGIITSCDFDKTRAMNIRLRVVRAMLLRSAAMVYYSDSHGIIKSVNITGYLSYYDSALGNNQEINVVKVKIGKDVFKQLNLSRLNLKELFVRVLGVKEATGLYSKEPFKLKEI